MGNRNEKIVIKSSLDAMSKYDRGNYTVDFYLPPYGEEQINELSDITYHGKDGQIPYHYHDQGVETFLILKGKVEVTLNGKRYLCEEGDFVNIPAHLPHGMVFLEEEVVLRSMFGGINCLAGLNDQELLSRNALSYVYDEAFMTEEYGPQHHYFTLTQPVDVESQDKETQPQITAKGQAIYEYGGWEGIQCQLKVGRWNLKRKKEIWEFKIDKNYQLQYFKPNAKEGVYVVKSGRVMVEVNGEVLFAETNDIIHIPSYTPYTLTALTDDTVVQDFNVSTRLFRMLEMLELAQRDEPEKVADAAWRKWLLDLNDCQLTGLIKIESSAHDR